MLERDASASINVRLFAVEAHLAMQQCGNAAMRQCRRQPHQMHQIHQIHRAPAVLLQGRADYFLAFLAAPFLAFFAGDFLAAFFFFAALGMCLYLFKWFECVLRTAAVCDAMTYEAHHKTVFEERDYSQQISCNQGDRRALATTMRTLSARANAPSPGSHQRAETGAASSCVSGKIHYKTRLFVHFLAPALAG
jgi:hypothetical protein